MDSLENDKAIVIKKLNQDDILEIIIEHFWENEGEFKNLLNSKAAFFGTPDKSVF